MKRVMCVYLPRWPLQNLGHAWRRSAGGPPAQEVGPASRAGPGALGAARLAAPTGCRRAACTTARRHRPATPGARRRCCCAAIAPCRPGCVPACPWRKAQAVEPRLVIHEEDPRSDVRGLQKLAAWAERFSPIVGLEEGPAPECLLLDVTGCGCACFHGEDRLVQHALRELHEEHWIARAAIADTVGTAWGFAHHMRTWYVAPPGEMDKNLLALPVAALRLPAEALRTLAQLGIERIGQLHALPRKGLASRFDAVVLQRLDQALGAAPELIVPHRSPPDVQAHCSFEYPTDRRELLQHALDHLLERVTGKLRKRNRGARQLECWLDHETSKPVPPRSRPVPSEPVAGAPGGTAANAPGASADCGAGARHLSAGADPGNHARTGGRALRSRRPPAGRAGDADRSSDQPVGPRGDRVCRTGGGPATGVCVAVREGRSRRSGVRGQGSGVRSQEEESVEPQAVFIG